MYMSIDRPGCIVAVSGFVGTPTTCERPVTHAGLVQFTSPVSVFLMFACTEHADRLIGSRLMLERDQAELDQRRQAHQDALQGRPFEHVQPLAVGSAAERLVERARAWAASQNATGPPVA